MTRETRAGLLPRLTPTARSRQTRVSIEQVQGAISANASVNARGAKLGSKWDSIGPTR